MKKNIIFILFFLLFFWITSWSFRYILAKKNNLYNNFLSLIFFNIIYLFIAIITFFFMAKISSLFSILFLLISIFHFSEDWKSEINIFQRLALATSVISFTVFFNKEEVTINLFSLTNLISQTILYYFFITLTLFLIPINFYYFF